MKIALLSDLHLSMHPLDLPHTDADVVVLAGDLGRPRAAIDWAMRYDRPTLFVPGNHEYYGSEPTVSALSELRALASATVVRVLERREWLHRGVRFLGCTLWSEHRLEATEEARNVALRHAVEMVRDFSRIRVAPGFQDVFTPALSRMLFEQSVEWLEERFAAPHFGPTVVTDFAPSRRSIHPRFQGSPLNGCFVSDLEDRILKWQPSLWLHGHVHDSFDYFVGSTRIVANPRGYAPGGVVENPRFDPTLVISVG